MKFLFDFFPILLFFAAYHLEGIYVATAVAMIASMVQIAAGWLLWRKLERMHWISALLIMLFGGMTLILQNPLFIMWKPTIVNWLFALVFLGSAFVGEKPLVQRMMEHVIQVPRTIWHRVNWAWVSFFLLSGAANIWVAYQFPEAVWVNFKLFGLMGMTFVFMILQGLYLGLYAERPAEIETNPSQEGDKRQ